MTYLKPFLTKDGRKFFPKKLSAAKSGASTVPSAASAAPPAVKAVPPSAKDTKLDAEDTKASAKGTKPSAKGTKPSAKSTKASTKGAKASAGAPSGNVEPTAADYEVGYGKPPKHTRFKPGNKRGKGRPKGSRNIASLVREEMEAMVPVKINGSVKRMSKLDLTVQQLFNKAAGGDLRATAMVLEFLERHGPPGEAAAISEDHAAYDLETLRHHLSKNEGKHHEG